MDETQALKRPRFFTGQMLTAESFKLEQEYFREKLKRHNRALHGFGIVSGLNVSVQSGQIIVEPGLALDCDGNELVISCAQTLAVASSTTDEVRAAYVCVRYVEEETDEIPALPIEPATASAGTGQASTTMERVTVEIAAENYNRGHRHLRARWLACGKCHPLTIAKLKRSSQGWRIERGYRPPRIK
jgi:hypothetical protein